MLRVPHGDHDGMSDKATFLGTLGSAWALGTGARAWAWALGLAAAGTTLLAQHAASTRPLACAEAGRAADAAR